MCSVLLLLLAFELLFCRSYSEVTAQADIVSRQTGSVITVSLRERTVSEYRRSLILNRYWRQDIASLDPEKEISKCCENWFGIYLYHVQPDGRIRITNEQVKWNWLLLTAAIAAVVKAFHRLYEIRYRRE